MGKTTGKPLSALRLKSMKQGETVSDAAENHGLRVRRTSGGTGNDTDSQATTSSGN